MNRYTIRLPEGLVDWYRREAEKKQRTLSQMLRMGLEKAKADWTRKRGPRKKTTLETESERARWLAERMRARDGGGKVEA